MDASPDDPWTGLTPTDIADVLSGSTPTWWIAGGWAIERFVPGLAREHGDLDIGCYRADVQELRRFMPEWEFYSAFQGTLHFLPPSKPVPGQVTSAWCRKKGARTWGVQLMIEESNRTHWIYRRNPRIRRALKLVLRRDSDMIRLLRPEIQLLYKSKSVREVDQLDFDAALPFLDSSDRVWLAGAIEAETPAHPWLAALDQT